MNRLRILVSIFLAVGAAVFVLRRASLRRLETEQVQLMQQADTASNRVTTVAPDASVTSTNAALSEAERLELLRLRSQVGQLRRDVTQATNQAARTALAPRRGSSTAPDEPIQTRGEMIQTMNRSRQWMIALILYAQEHRQRLPAMLNEAAPFASGVESADDFEMVGAGFDLSTNRSPATTIILREKQTWKTGNGKWHRTYAFADGHSESAVSDTADFTEWEQKKAQSDLNPAQ